MGRKPKLDDELMRRANSLLRFFQFLTTFVTLVPPSPPQRVPSYPTPPLPFQSLVSFPEHVRRQNDPFASSTRHFNWQHSRYPLSLFSATSIPIFFASVDRGAPEQEIRRMRHTANSSTQQKAQSRRSFVPHGWQQEQFTFN